MYIDKGIVASNRKEPHMCNFLLVLDEEDVTLVDDIEDLETTDIDDTCRVYFACVPECPNWYKCNN